MESIWQHFKKFIQESFTNKFKAFFSGFLMGLFGAKSLFFSGLSSEMVTIGAYVIKFMGTIFMAFGSGLATAYAARLMERKKKK